MTRVPMTKAGAEKLRSELEHLKTVARRKVVNAIAEARAHGDLKENAEYHAAKEQQGFIEGRIAEIEHKLGNAHIVDIHSLDVGDKVVFGATVDLFNTETEDEVTYQIVGDDEADLKEGKISVSSPLARAIIGKSVGDEVVAKTPGGEVIYEIIEVRYL
ncbi:transcription elongation factor GreA [Thioalbus denitrificans]|uniref:Transcription elongation factor GreA n=1 Tax=Thioalbus denitrificans TaxID=547122 RepID=A0A369C6T8_9GAMM|nr:transcription elongation factor GreA [Thioalbus denitrificans]RCX28327.1 transcription elongation factor GreA [Thioalbus denitrificans]